MTKRGKAFLLAAAFLAVCITAHAEDEPSGGYTDAEIAEMMNNPLGHLWIIFIQNDAIWYSGPALDLLGEDDKVMNTTTIQPVMPMQLTEDWKLILRPVIPINSFDVPASITISPAGSPPTSADTVSATFDRKTGLGDIVLWNAFATNEMAKPPNVFGFGPTIMMDTATDDVLGTGKWSAGPLFLGIHIGDKWTYGAVAQHWWSFAGDDDRDDVSLSDFQYILNYSVTDETSIGFSPNVRYNWNAPSGERLTFPVGLGVDTMIKIGPAPVNIGASIYYYVETSEPVGPKWQLRIFVSPIVPSPSWAKKPIF